MSADTRPFLFFVFLCMVACSPDKCDVKGKDNMENTMINRIIPLIILLVAGCAPAFTHTTSHVLDTNPQGATVICDGQDTGYAPIVFHRSENSDIVGKNRALNEEDIKKIMEVAKIRQGTLKVGENKALTDKDTIQAIRTAESRKIVHGELKLGENTIVSDEFVKGLIEATKIVDGELKPEEATVLTDAKTMQVLIQLVKKIKAETSICTAYWSSGVSKKYPSSIPFIYAGNGTLIYTLQRPEGAGYTQDAEFALKIKQLQQSQQTAELNALIAIRSAEAQERSARAQEYQNTKSTTCTTTLGITRCY